MLWFDKVLIVPFVTCGVSGLGLELRPLNRKVPSSISVPTLGLFIYPHIRREKWCGFQEAESKETGTSESSCLNNTPVRTLKLIIMRKKLETKSPCGSYLHEYTLCQL